MLKKKIAVFVFSCLAGLPFALSAAESGKSLEQSAEVASAHEEQASTINLNTASAEALQEALVGVGKVKAQAIVDHREEYGPFSSVDGLLEVKGIGAATLEKNREKLTVN